MNERGNLVKVMVIVGSSLFLAIAISIGLIIYNVVSEKNSSFENLNENLETSEVQSLNEAILVKLKKCNNDESCKDKVIEKAISKNDEPKLCDSFDYVSYCKIQLLTEEAFKEDRPELCNQLKNSQNCKDNYYFSKAAEEKNLDLCEKIVDDEQKKICLDKINYNRAVNDEDCSILFSETYINACNR
tara:strand:- start:1095 stop:1655 length:561 start_codon:yes stop_codon:yes gene_type:complete